MCNIQIICKVTGKKTIKQEKDDNYCYLCKIKGLQI